MLEIADVDIKATLLRVSRGRSVSSGAFIRKKRSLSQDLRCSLRKVKRLGQIKHQFRQRMELIKRRTEINSRKQT